MKTSLLQFRTQLQSRAHLWPGSGGRQLKRISLNFLGKKRSPLERREKKKKMKLGTEVTTWCVFGQIQVDQVWSSFFLFFFAFFPSRWQLLYRPLLLSMQKRKKKASLDSIFISLLCHPCGCLHRYLPSLHKVNVPSCRTKPAQSPGPQPIQRFSPIGESTFWQFVSGWTCDFYACRIGCAYHGWHSGKHVEAR